MIAKSERLIIRRFTEQDLDLIYEINNHPECIKFNGWDSMSVEDCKNVLEKWMSGYLDHIGLGAFCVETVENHTPIGMSFIVKSEEENAYEIGFRLRRDRWGKGYAKELVKLYAEYGKQILKANKLTAEVDAENFLSRNVFEKMEFDKKEHPNGPTGILYELNLQKDKICN